jgi:glycosyltransferase involved in cell wall biosynthesis
VTDWVIVAGTLHDHGGMDRANAELVRHLARRGATVHVVAHHVAADLLDAGDVRVHRVRRPARSFALGAGLLARAGRRVARRLSGRGRAPRVVVNGGNCAWPGLNWVHCVHHAWSCVDHGAPAWFRVKNRIVKAAARRAERPAIESARLVVANSRRTAADVVRLLRVSRARVRVVYPGSDPHLLPASRAERAEARTRFGVAAGRPVVAFLGSLGYDRNKGFDTLLEAWRELCRDPGWDADLLAAGGGVGLGWWHRDVERRGLGGRVRMLGFVQDVRTLLAASDLLVSPVRYEGYGLNVQEAACRGVPVLVSRTAGIAERVEPIAPEMILSDPEDGAALAETLRRWREDHVTRWRDAVEPVAAALRSPTWDEMAGAIVELAADGRPAPMGSWLSEPIGASRV